MVVVIYNACIAIITNEPSKHFQNVQTHTTAAIA